MKTQITNPHTNLVGIQPLTVLQSPSTTSRYEAKKRIKTMILAIVSAALFSMLPSASAQEFGGNGIPTNLPGTTTSIAPPSGFNPLTASDSELAIYGFPPRPDRNVSANAYTNWAKAMQASKERVFPVLEVTNRFNGQNVATGKIGNGTSSSYHWSGSVDTTTATSYGPNSFHWVASDFEVPVANQAFGACTGGWDYSSSWVGIDGYGSGDVLQAGTESDAFCWAGFRNTSYVAWYEWYPNYAVQIPNLPVAPGDEMFVQVWSASSTYGYAYLVNLSTNQYVVIGFSAPGGTHLVGNSAEWIVERPSVGGGLATLTNYVSDYFSSADTATFGGAYYYPGSAGTTMVDNYGRPISYPTLLGISAIWFQDEGSAW